MKINKRKLRKSAIILFENIEEDLGINYNGDLSRYDLINLWKEKNLATFFVDNPDVDDILLLEFDGDKRELMWIMSKETNYNSWIDQTCEHTEHIKKWLETYVMKT